MMSAYQVLTLEGQTYELLEQLGTPSSEGEVFRAVYKTILDCAIKIVSADKVDIEALQTEVALLALLRHTNVVKITAWATAPSQLQLPLLEAQDALIIMDFVDGKPLDTAWPALATAEELLLILEQLFDGVGYLHDRGVLHVDLKPKNILVQEQPRRVVVIDLGFSVVADEGKFRTHYRHASSELQKVLGRTKVYVDFNENYARSDRARRRQKEIPRQEISDDWYPGHDLYALGVILRDALKAPRVGALLSPRSRLRKGLEIIRDRLLGERYPEGASGALRDIRKLQAGYLSPSGVQELASVPESGSFIILSDQAIPFSDRAMKLVGHPLFQRLRNISQLDFELLLYPGARHSRFAHSVSTFHLATQALAHMLSDPSFRLNVDAPDLEGVLLFALLHDVAHYPLLHMFEDFRGRKAGDGETVQLDDELFEDFITGLPGLPLSRRQRPMIGKESIVDLVRDAFGDATLDALLSISRCANESKVPHTPIHRILAGLLSSAIDLDKVAYLQMDSDMTGIRYGRGVDVHGLVSALRAPPTVLEERSEGHPVIGVDERGLAAAESVILARYWMLHRVYWHHTNRAIMASFKHVINALLESNTLSFLGFISDNLWMSDMEAARWLSKRFGKLNDGGVNPIAGLLGGQRTIYRRLLVASLNEEPELYTAIARLPDPGLIEDALAPFAKVRPGMVTIDAPNRGRDRLHLERIRVLRERDGDVVREVPFSEELDKSSLRAALVSASPRGVAPRPEIRGAKTLKETVAGGVQGEFLNEVKKCRVFLHPVVGQKLEEEGRTQEAEMAVREALLSR